MLYPVLPILVGLTEGIAEATQNIVYGSNWIKPGNMATPKSWTSRAPLPSS
jgi:hypothetical protein